MTSKERYADRKLRGVCVRCGKDRGNSTNLMCDGCNGYYKANYLFYIQHKICPSCKSEKLWGDEKYCLNCRDKILTRTEKRRKEKPEQIRMTNKEYYHKRHEYLLKSGICVRCGKAKATPNYKTCALCRHKESMRYRGQL